MDRNILIDGNNLLHRAYAIFVQARQDRGDSVFTSDKGYPTGLIYGALSMLSDWLPAIEHPTRIVMFLDGVPKRRRDIDPTYKVKDPTEGPAPGTAAASVHLLDEYEAANEIDVITHILKLLGVTVYHHPYEEADDLIASYAVQRPGEIHVIVSSDKDFFQIVSDTIIVYRPDMDANKRFFDPERAEELMYQRYKVRVPPHAVRLFKSLTGDPSDGIVGVPRLRKKVAAPLCTLPDVAAVYASGFPGFSKAEREHTEALRERIELNYLLTGFFRDIDLAPLCQSLPVDVEMASRILREDFQIYGIDIRSFRSSSTHRVRIGDIVPQNIPGLFPSNFLDDL